MKQKNNVWEIFRGLAALLVMFHHYTVRYDELIGHRDTWPLQSQYGGQYGVCMFFIFTGFFLIPSLNRAGSYRGFLYKRAIRLYPYYIPCVLITFAIMFFTPPLCERNVSWSEFLINLTMLQSFVGIPSVDGAYWTLSVQLLVYSLIGGLFFVCRRKIRSFLWCVIVWFLIDIVLSIVSKMMGPIPMSFFALLNFLHLFLQGLLIYSLNNEPNSINRKIGITLLFGSTAYSLFYFGVHYFFFDCLLVGVIYWISYNHWTYKRKNIFTFLGAISFPVYLLHQNIGFLMIRYMESVGLTNEFFVLIPMFMVVLMGWAVTHLVENFIIPILCKKEEKFV